MADISRSLYKDLTYENYTTQKIDSIEVRNADNTVAMAGTGNNNYVLKGNFLTQGLDSSTLQRVTNRLLDNIKEIEYTPVDSNTKGNPCIEVGDMVTYLTDEKVHINTFVLQRTLKGIQALGDSFTSEGSEYLEFGTSNTKSDISGINNVMADFGARISALDQAGGLKVMSVESVPKNPITGVLYLIQGEVVVN